MCGRFVLFSDKDSTEIDRIIRDIERKYGADAFDGTRLLPGNHAPVYIAKNEKASAQLMIWGYQKYDSEDLIYNARSETVFEKKLFAASMHQHRCIVPATCFFEGRREKKGECLFTLQDEPVLYLAGLYRPGTNGEADRFVILTTKANASVSPYHHRMPVLLPKPLVRPWLFDSMAARDALQCEQPMLLSQPT